MQKNEKIYLPSLKYNPGSKDWEPIYLQENEIQNLELKDLKIATYNIWFDRYNFTMRGIAIRKLLEQTGADFIGLQEVIKESYVELLQEGWIQKNYYVSNVEIKGYHTLILSKHPCRFFKKPLSSEMSRDLLYAQLIINKKLLCIATVHLESLGKWQMRALQLKDIFDEFKNEDRVVIMGDHNFDNDKENKKIDSNYQDLWKLIYPSIQGETMKPNIKYPPWRPDKILVKKAGGLLPFDIQRIGMDPIEISEDSSEKKHSNNQFFVEPDIKTPSDHYGLVAQLLLDYGELPEELVPNYLKNQNESKFQRLKKYLKESIFSFLN